MQSGELYLDKIHHARADDCAEQRFRSVLDASYYVNSDNNVREGDGREGKGRGRQMRTDIFDWKSQGDIFFWI